MKKKYNYFIYRFTVYFLFFSAYSFASDPITPQQKADAQEWMQSQSTKGFIENKGQIIDNNNNPVPDVLFKSDLPGVDMYLTTNGLTYVFLKYTKEEQKESKNGIVEKMLAAHKPENIKADFARVDIVLKDATIKKENIVTEYPSQEDYRYYLGHCPQGITGVRKYKKVTIKEVYAGIDWIWYVNKDGVVKYDFEVHPHADLTQIQMQYKWADIKTLNNGKSLNISTPVGELTEGSAVSYNNRETIITRYELKDNTVSFKTGRYNANQNLTIDPPLQLVWNSRYGGDDVGRGLGIACDKTGNIFVTGTTKSTDFPTYTVTGAYNQGTLAGIGSCFILKFTANGILTWATYYGGSKDDQGTSICSDGNGNIFITGIATSTNIPTYNPGGGAYSQTAKGFANHCFILKFDNNGVRKWATYFGGSFLENGNAICADEAGNIFVTGGTISPDMPTLDAGSGAYFDGTYLGYGKCFIVKFDNNGVLKWSTFYGGTLYDEAYSIATDATGNIFVTGTAASSDFPTYDPGSGAYYQGAMTGAQNSFILKFTNNGVRSWATFYGGGDSDEGHSIVTDATGNVFVTGTTGSGDFPTRNPGSGAYYNGTYAGNSDCFISKFDNNNALVWSTYFGGSGSDNGSSISTDGTGNIFVAGVSASTNLPTLNLGSGAYFQGTNGGNGDLFFSMFTNSGVMQSSTYLGGKGNDGPCYTVVNHNCDLYFTGDGGGNLYNPTNYSTYPSVDAGGGAWYQSQPGTYDDYPVVGRFKGAANCLPQLIEKNTIENSVKIIPNPSNGNFLIETTITEKQLLELFDITGKLMFTHIIENGRTMVDAGNIAEGIYNVRITSGEQKTNKQLVIVK